MTASFPTGGGTSARLWAVTHEEAMTDPVNYTVPAASVTDGDWLVIGSGAAPTMVTHDDWLAAQDVHVGRTWRAVGSGGLSLMYAEYVAVFDTGSNSARDYRVRVDDHGWHGPNSQWFRNTFSPGQHAATDFHGNPPTVANALPDPAGSVPFPTATVSPWMTGVAPSQKLTVYLNSAGLTYPPTVTIHIDSRFAEAGTPILYERQAGKWVQMSDKWAAPHGAMHPLDPPKPVAHHARMWQDPPGRWVSIGESAIFDGSHWIRP